MVWNRQKPEEAPPRSEPRYQADPAGPPRHTSPSSGYDGGSQRASIGKSVHIKGNVTAKEDLTIDGTVEGQVTVQNHSLSIGANSRITSTIRAKSVIVGGEVEGDITAADRVEIAATGSMLGDIAAPRVVLADGARFKGSIDMEPANAGRSEPKPEAVSSKGLSKTA
jgi:cytoskeletal protein CcmA (bactofilin family)